MFCEVLQWNMKERKHKAVMKGLYSHIILHLKNVRIKTFHDRFVENLRRQKNLGLKLNKDFLKLKQAMFGMKINYA